MKNNQIIRKSVSIFLYAAVLYYLLPFRPLYLYFIAHHYDVDKFYEQSDQPVSTTQYSILLTAELHHNKDTFPKKDRVRFFFNPTFIVTPFINTFVFYYTNQTTTIQQSTYQNPSVLFQSGRSPPLV